MSAERQSAPVMGGPPDYFHPIRDRASKRWNQFEADPELAGPWHPLFKQVQSPRHILPELLQNADNAGATEARVSIADQRFVFEHNGEDFVETRFASICRFGYSNKHALRVGAALGGRRGAAALRSERALPGARTALDRGRRRGLLDQKPDAYSFILVNPEGEPVEMTGARLRAPLDGGEIIIHPATYRLVYDLDQ